MHTSACFPPSHRLTTCPNKNELFYVMRLESWPAEIWDPKTEQWRLLNTPAAVARTYHSTAVLVPDGRVFVGGGGLCFTCPPDGTGKICECLNNHLDAEMFSPPYLFNSDGTLADRPTIEVDLTVVGACYFFLRSSTTLSCCVAFVLPFLHNKLCFKPFPVHVEI